MDARIKYGHDKSILAARIASEWMHGILALENRGRRESRVANAPAASRAKIKKHTSVVTTGSPVSPGLPCAMVLTVSFGLSPVTGLCCHRRLANCFAKLDASVGASGPHDFAVRASTARLASLPRPSHPALNVRDDAYVPLNRGGTGRACRDDLPDGESEIFLQRGLDSDFAKLPVGQITS